MAIAPESVPVIAIDGPGGSGKGTISRAVARALHWHLLDSGALYRLVALAAGRRNLPLAGGAGEAPLARLARDLDARFTVRDGEEQIFLGTEDVTAELRDERAGQGASAVAVLPAVRLALLQRQRDFRRPPGLVADGRDMATVVFPDAGLKVFLTASAVERAQRRHKQLKEKGIDVSLAALLSDMAERDRRDSERAVAPLVPGKDARLFDTTDLGIEEVVATVLRWAGEAFPGVVPQGD